MVQTTQHWLLLRSHSVCKLSHLSVLCNSHALLSIHSRHRLATTALPMLSCNSRPISQELQSYMGERRCGEPVPAVNAEQGMTVAQYAQVKRFA